MELNEYLTYGIFPLLAISMIFVLYRLVKGPSVPDRIISLDLMINSGIGIIVVYSIINDQPAFLDIAMVLALIAFLGTISFSYYLKQKNLDDHD